MVIAFVNPVSLFSASQPDTEEMERSAELAGLLRGTQFVPVTGLDEAQLLDLPVVFDSWQILLHGAVVIDDQGAEDPAWRRLTLQAQREAEQALTLAGQAAQHIRALHQLDLEVETVMRHGAPLLVRLTQPLGLAGPLAEAADLCRGWVAEGPFSGVLGVLSSPDAVTILPRAVSPEGAVSYVIQQVEEPTLTIGISREPGDAAFLARCDYALVPGDWPLAAEDSAPTEL